MLCLGGSVKATPLFSQLNGEKISVEKIKELFGKCAKFINGFISKNKFKVLIGSIIGVIAIIAVVVGCTSIKGDNNVIVKGNNDSVTNTEHLLTNSSNVCIAENCNCPCKHIGE